MFLNNKISNFSFDISRAHPQYPHCSRLRGRTHSCSCSSILSLDQFAKGGGKPVRASSKLELSLLCFWCSMQKLSPGFCHSGWIGRDRQARRFWSLHMMFCGQEGSAHTPHVLRNAGMMSLYIGTTIWQVCFCIQFDNFTCNTYEELYFPKERSKIHPNNSKINHMQNHTEFIKLEKTSDHQVQLMTE